jgi:hypothetical protein
MRCRRICRELLWLARFGEFGPSSAPHLDHLAGCGACRDEDGFDRALVQQLRVALAERIANEEPSPGAWSVILARTQAPEVSGFTTFLGGLAGRLRTATAVSAVALAAIVATSTQISVMHPEAGSAETEVRRSAAGDQFERQPLVPRPRRVATPVIYVAAAAPSDPEAAFLVSASLPGGSSAAAVEDEPAVEESVIEAELSIGTSLSRLTPADSHETASSGPVRDPAPREGLPAGEPY